MTNVLDAIAPKILARGMLQFRQQAIMPRIVNSDFSAEAAQKGDTINIPIPGQITVEDVTPSHTPPEPPEQTANVVSIKLDKWKKAAFYLTDKELMQIDADKDFIPLHMKEAVSALASAVNKSLLSLYDHAEHIIGHPDRTLFNQTTEAEDTYGIKPIIAARKYLNQAGAPKEGRYAILSFENEANLVALPQFADAHRAGDNKISIEGEIGKRYGINWIGNEDVVKLAPFAADRMTSQSLYRAGSTRIQLNGVNKKIEKGAMLIQGTRVLGHVEEAEEIKTATVADTTIKSQVVTLRKPLTSIMSTSTDVTHPALHENNMIFHADAFALAMRPLSAATENIGLGNRIMSVTDPESGLSMRLEISRQYKQTVWEFDILWGVSVVRPEWLIRLVG